MSLCNKDREGLQKANKEKHEATSVQKLFKRLRLFISEKG